MSKGLGHVGRTIAALIEAEPHGAWTMTEICAAVYPGETKQKKHRVAITRAIKKMKLPACWVFENPRLSDYLSCLYNVYDDESTQRAYFANWRRGTRRPLPFDKWIQENPQAAKNAQVAAQSERDGSVKLYSWQKRPVVGLSVALCRNQDKETLIEETA
jgi:hypothetical protein